MFDYLAGEGTMDGGVQFSDREGEPGCLPAG